MKCEQCPFVLPCWGGTLDSMGQCTLCLQCHRFIVPSVPLEPQHASPNQDKLGAYVVAYAFKCEQRPYSPRVLRAYEATRKKAHANPEATYPGPRVGFKHYGPPLKGVLALELCGACDGTYARIYCHVIDLDEELADQGETNINPFSLDPHKADPR